MNIQNVMKTASIVNYVKPKLEMLEMETEGSLLLTASTQPASVGIKSTPGTFTGGNTDNKLSATRRL